MTNTRTPIVLPDRVVELASRRLVPHIPLTREATPFGVAREALLAAAPALIAENVLVHIQALEIIQSDLTIDDADWMILELRIQTLRLFAQSVLP